MASKYHKLICPYNSGGWKSEISFTGVKSRGLGIAFFMRLQKMFGSLAFSWLLDAVCILWLLASVPLTSAPTLTSPALTLLLSFHEDL